jgi:hypothetical protein
MLPEGVDKLLGSAFTLVRFPMKKETEVNQREL